MPTRNWEEIFQHGEPFQPTTIAWLMDIEAALLAGGGPGGVGSVSAADSTITVGGSAVDVTLKVAPGSIGTSHLSFDPATQAELDASVATTNTNLGLKVDKDSAVGGTTRIVANKVNVANAQPNFRILGTGKHDWGPGGSTAVDTFLQRGGVGVLRTEAAFIAATSLTCDEAVGGNPLNIGDVSLYRFGVATVSLNMNASLGVVNAYGDSYSQISLNLNQAGAGLPGLKLGAGGASPPDITLYRVASGPKLKTDNYLVVGNQVQGLTDVVAWTGDASRQVTIGAGGGGSTPQIVFGTTGDTNLYRSAADTLKTDDSFEALKVTVSGNPSAALELAAKQYVDTSAGGTPWTVVTKPSDTSRASTTTMSADPHLVFTPASGGLYEWEMIIVYVGANQTADLKLGFGQDTVARGLGMAIAFYSTSEAPTATVGNYCAPGTAAIGSFGTDTATRLLKVAGWYVGTGASAGLWWAQATSDAGNVTVKASSVLRYRRIV